MIREKSPHLITDDTKDRFICLFTNCEAGWIDFEFIYNEKILYLQFTDIYFNDGPVQYVEWIEKVYRGSKEIYIHDAEDYQMELSYRNGVFKAEKTHSDEKGLFEIEIDKETLCKELYTSFVYFTESPLYKSEEIDEDEWNPEGFFESEIPLTKVRSEFLDSLNWSKYPKRKLKICSDYVEALANQKEDFDWKSWHENEITFAKKLLMNLPADCELWYSKPIADKSGLLKKDTLIYLSREDIYGRTNVDFKFGRDYLV